MTKRILSISLCFLLLFSLLSGCGKKQEILPEVVEAFEIDEETEKYVEELFASFDKAFATLEKHKPVDDEDFDNYRHRISQAVTDFDYVTDDKLSTGFKKLNGSSDANNKDVQELFDKREAITWATFDMLDSIASGEASFEAAVNYVNAYSRLFYGEDRITDDDLDRLAE